MLMLSVSLAGTIELSKSNTASLRESFSQGSVAKVIVDLQQLHSSLLAHEEINLYIYSPGGSIMAGDELIKFVNSLGRKVNVICDFCASMAFQTLQNIKGRRLITSFGVLMSHKAYGGFEGEFPGQIESRLNFWLERVKKYDEITVARSNGKQTLESYQALYENEYWCTEETCITKGFADESVNITCAKDMSGTVNEIVDAGMFGRFEVVLSRCPLVSGILKYREINEDGKPFGPYITNKGEMSLSVILKTDDSDAIKQINKIKM